MSLFQAPDVLCGSILDVDKNVQSVAIINNKGRVVENISKPTFEERFPNHLSELFCMHHVLQVSMGRDFDENNGPINYHISERTYFTMLTFPVRENVILVNSNKSASMITLARKITSILNEH